VWARKAETQVVAGADAVQAGLGRGAGGQGGSGGAAGTGGSAGTGAGAATSAGSGNGNPAVGATVMAVISDGLSISRAAERNPHGQRVPVASLDSDFVPVHIDSPRARVQSYL
jgi:hypothetical protein